MLLRKNEVLADRLPTSVLVGELARQLRVRKLVQHADLTVNVLLLTVEIGFAELGLKLFGKTRHTTMLIKGSLWHLNRAPNIHPWLVFEHLGRLSDQSLLIEASRRLNCWCFLFSSYSIDQLDLDVRHFRRLSIVLLRM